MGHQEEGNERVSEREYMIEVMEGNNNNNNNKKGGALQELGDVPFVEGFSFLGGRSSIQRACIRSRIYNSSGC